MPSGAPPIAALPGRRARIADPVGDRPPAFVWTATGLERQIFLDHTGRRGRRVRLAGGTMAFLSAAWLAALVTGSIGFSTLPDLPPTIGVAGRPPARVVHVAAAHHVRRRVVEAPALHTASAQAAHALVRSETDSPSGTIR